MRSPMHPPNFYTQHSTSALRTSTDDELAKSATQASRLVCVCCRTPLRQSQHAISLPAELAGVDDSTDPPQRMRCAWRRISSPIAVRMARLFNGAGQGIATATQLGGRASWAMPRSETSVRAYCMHRDLGRQCPLHRPTAEGSMRSPMRLLGSPRGISCTSSSGAESLRNPVPPHLARAHVPIPQPKCAYKPRRLGHNPSTRPTT